MTKKINMIFKTADNKNATISIANPKEDVTRAEVLAVMNNIIDKNVFLTSKHTVLTAISDVTVRTTDETTLA